MCPCLRWRLLVLHGKLYACCTSLQGDVNVKWCNLCAWVVLLILALLYFFLASTVLLVLYWQSSHEHAGSIELVADRLEHQLLFSVVWAVDSLTLRFYGPMCERRPVRRRIGRCGSRVARSRQRRRGWSYWRWHNRTSRPPTPWNRASAERA